MLRLVLATSPSNLKVLCVVVSVLAWLFSAAGCARHEQQKQPMSGSTGSVSTESVSVLDLDSVAVEPLKPDASTAKVFLFTRSDCPISNRYAPEVNRLHAEFAKQGVAFFLVYPDPDQSVDGIRQHMMDFSYRCQALRDPDHVLAARTGAKITPEAAVFLGNGSFVYCGRIDDRYVDFGKQRAQPQVKDLENTLKSIVAGTEVSFSRTEAVGCFISDLKPR